MDWESWQRICIQHLHTFNITCSPILVLVKSHELSKTAQWLRKMDTLFTAGIRLTQTRIETLGTGCLYVVRLKMVDSLTPRQYLERTVKDHGKQLDTLEGRFAGLRERQELCLMASVLVDVGHYVLRSQARATRAMEADDHGDLH